MKYRKKPVEIRAVQLVRGNDAAIMAFMESTGCPFEIIGDHEMDIHTLEGTMRADCGDWIICGVKGEFYPCKPDVFAVTYEPVGGPTEEQAHG